MSPLRFLMLLLLNGTSSLQNTYMPPEIWSIPAQEPNHQKLIFNFIFLAAPFHPLFSSPLFTMLG